MLTETCGAKPLSLERREMTVFYQRNFTYVHSIYRQKESLNPERTMQVEILDRQIVACNLVDYRGCNAEDIGRCIEFLEEVKGELEK